MFPDFNFLSRKKNVFRDVFYLSTWTHLFPSPLSTSPSPPNLLPLSPFSSPYFPLPLLSFTLLPSPLLLSPLSLVLSPEPYAWGRVQSCPTFLSFGALWFCAKAPTFFNIKEVRFLLSWRYFFYCCFSPHFKQGRNWHEVRRPRLTFLMKNATEDA